MTLGIDHTLPRWLIDDTADLGNARIFVVHTQEPRLIGELLPEDEAGLDAIQFSGLAEHQVLTRINWIDAPAGRDQLEEMAASLDKAVRDHMANRSGERP